MYFTPTLLYWRKGRKNRWIIFILSNIQRRLKSEEIVKLPTKIGVFGNDLIIIFMEIDRTKIIWVYLGDVFDDVYDI